MDAGAGGLAMVLWLFNQEEANEYFRQHRIGNLRQVDVRFGCDSRRIIVVIIDPDGKADDRG
jgi:hypothetical protein